MIRPGRYGKPRGLRAAALALLACAAAMPTRAQITIAAASNARYAMEALLADFRKASGIEAKAVYGASGKLAAQIREGAPFDVFVSADMEFPDSLRAWTYAAAAPRIYAYGQLVLWTAKDLDVAKGMGLLGDAAVAKIGLADPRTAPYGREAVKAMKKAGLYARVAGKLAFGESIAQVNQFVATGNVDVGFTAKSVVLAPETAGVGRWAEVDPALYDRIAQGAVVCKYGTEHHRDPAAAFYAYLYADAARSILGRYGYALP